MMSDSERLLAEVLLSQKALMAEVRSLRDIVEGRAATNEGWMRSADAAIALKPEGVLSAQHLRKLLNANVFSAQKGEIRNVSPGQRPTWEYDIAKCKKALQRHFKNVQSAS